MTAKTMIANTIGLLCLFLSPLSSVKVTPDWSVFNIIADVNISKSVEIVENLPVHKYWDYERGGFRTGIIGDIVKDSFPELVTLSRKQISGSNEKLIRLVNVTVVDKPLVFMHTLVAVKYLAQLASDFQNRLNALVAEKYDFSLKILRIANQTGTEWRTASEIRAARNNVLLKIENRKKKLKLLQNQEEFNIELRKMKHEGSLKLLQEHHENMIKARAGQYSRYEVLDNQTFAERRKLMVAAEDERAITQQKMLEAQQQEETAKLQLEMNMSLDALKFRYAEQSRVERENEDVMRHIMQAKAENMRKSFEQIVTSIRGLISQFVVTCMNQPLNVLAGVAMVLSLLLTYIFCVEFAEAIKMYIMHVLYPHKSVRDAKRGPRTARNSPSVSGNILNNRDSMSVPPPVPVLSQANSHSLKELSDICCLCARTIDHPIPLPNVLILGPPGTGKTMCAEAIAIESGLPYVTLLGADILAASSKLSFGSSTGPGGILRDTLEAAVRANGGKGFLVILDEADGVIADRGLSKAERSNKSDTVHTSVECIHILLHRLRVGNPALGVLITTTMGVEEVDPALLDRMDRIVSLELPSVYLRFKCIVQYALQSLEKYMQKSDVDDLQAILTHVSKSESGTDGWDIDNVRELLEAALEKTVTMPTNDFVSSWSKLEQKETEAKAFANPRGSKRGSSVSTEAFEETKEQSMVDGSPSNIISPAEAFDLASSLLEFVRLSEGWSFRELDKVVQNIMLDVLSTKECVLTSALWMRQVYFKVQASPTTLSAAPTQPPATPAVSTTVRGRGRKKADVTDVETDKIVEDPPATAATSTRSRGRRSSVNKL